MEHDRTWNKRFAFDAQHPPDFAPRNNHAELICMQSILCIPTPRYIFFHPIYYLRPYFLSFLVVTQIRGGIAGSSLPCPLRFVPCILSQECVSSFFPRRLASISNWQHAPRQQLAVALLSRGKHHFGQNGLFTQQPPRGWLRAAQHAICGEQHSSPQAKMVAACLFFGRRGKKNETPFF